MRNLQHFLGFVNLYSHVIKDVCECTASSVQNKSSSLLFMGPLRPLSVPGWPCSHISLNLISVNNWPVFQRCSLCGSAKTAHNYRKCSASNSSCIFASSYRKPFGIKGLRVRGIPGTTATSIPIQEGLFCSSFWAASPLPLARAALLTTQERSKRLAYLRHGTHLLCRFDYLPKMSSYEMYFRNYFRIALRPVRPEANENHSKSCSAQCKVA